MASNVEQVVTIGRHLQVQTPRQEVVPVLGRPSTEAVRIARRSESDDRVASEPVEIVSIDPTPTSEDLDEEAQTQLWFG